MSGYRAYAISQFMRPNISTLNIQLQRLSPNPVMTSKNNLQPLERTSKTYLQPQESAAKAFFIPSSNIAKID